ncbi:MAG: hypothetical protein KKB50_05655, partial [Planctomycetes bacterium]|nr:hypothetical protein [Planctomycetota bacterium]
MNTARLFLAAGAVALLLTPGLVGEERLLSSPGFSASRVADDGTVHEEWGTFGLRLCKPDGAEPGGGGYSARPVPVALTSCAAGQVTLTQTAYRAPIWPSGVDVVLAQVTNRSDAATPIGLEVSLPENA